MCTGARTISRKSCEPRGAIKYNLMKNIARDVKNKWKFRVLESWDVHVKRNEGFLWKCRKQKMRGKHEIAHSAEKAEIVRLPGESREGNETRWIPRLVKWAWIMHGPGDERRKNLVQAAWEQAFRLLSSSPLAKNQINFCRCHSSVISFSNFGWRAERRSKTLAWWINFKIPVCPFFKAWAIALCMRATKKKSSLEAELPSNFGSHNGFRLLLMESAHSN